MKTSIAPRGALKALTTSIGAIVLALSSVHFASAQSNTGSTASGVETTTNGINALLSVTTGVYNTAYGINALKLNTTGSYNTAVGPNALVLNVGGTQNTGVGVNALQANIGGSYNVGLGVNALFANTSGNYNTGVGNSALNANTTGAQNTAIGLNAMLANKGGSFNSALGLNALASNVSGNNNTAVGYRALLAATGTNNIGLGLNGGKNLTTGGNNIDIGNDGVAGESGIIRIGTGGTHLTTYIAGVINGNGSGLTGVPAAALTGTISGTQIAPGVTLNGTTNGSFNGPLTGDVSGNAATATKLQNARNINGVPFDGSANITIPAAAGSLTGTTLASGVTASSLTSVGTLGSLTVNGNALFCQSDNAAVGFDAPPYGRLGFIKKSGANPMIASASGEPILFGQTDQPSVLTNIAGATLTEQMRIDSSGNVGIGTTSPKGLLHVSGDYYGKGHVFLHAFEGDGNSGTAYVQARDDSGTSSIGLTFRTQEGATLHDAIYIPPVGVPRINRGIIYLDNPTASAGYALVIAGRETIGGANQGMRFLTTNGPGAADQVTAMTIQSNGNVGIGTYNPTQAKLVVLGSVGRTPYTTIGYYGADTYNYGISDGGGADSIYASAQVVAASFVAFSDERIKNIVGRSDGAEDLRKLSGIEITDYHYKDVIAKGDRPQKKVIAQQVEKVFPQAVSRTTDVVPDIYQLAPIQDGWVSLATDLKVGDRVKLITDNKDGIEPVLEVREGAFRTAFQPGAEKVFVYGREVQDFRRVDYEAISMLNVSATQQIKKEKDAEVKALQDENAVLKHQLAAMGEQQKAQEKRLAALEARDPRVARGGNTQGKRPARAINASLSLR